MTTILWNFSAFWYLDVKMCKLAYCSEFKESLNENMFIILLAFFLIKLKQYIRQRSWTLATNLNFLIHISLPLNGVNLWYFKALSWSSWFNRDHSLRCQVLHKLSFVKKWEIFFFLTNSFELLILPNYLKLVINSLTQ